LLVACLDEDPDDIVNRKQRRGTLAGIAVWTRMMTIKYEYSTTEMVAD
jgi:hypothetical protein